jgi:hypothetical protein
MRESTASRTVAGSGSASSPPRSPRSRIAVTSASTRNGTPPVRSAIAAPVAAGASRPSRRVTSLCVSPGPSGSRAISVSTRACRSASRMARAGCPRGTASLR